MALAVAVLTVDYGHLPYIALLLAASFGSYSLIKKRLSLPPAEGLFVESAVLALPALAYLIWLNATGGAEFGHVSAGAHDADGAGRRGHGGTAAAVRRVGRTGCRWSASASCSTWRRSCSWPAVCCSSTSRCRRRGWPVSRLVWIALIIFTVDGDARRAPQDGKDRAAADPTAATVEPAAALPPR